MHVIECTQYAEETSWNRLGSISGSYQVPSASVSVENHPALQYEPLPNIGARREKAVNHRLRLDGAGELRTMSHPHPSPLAVGLRSGLTNFLTGPPAPME